jgi:hypothetical protein
MQTSTASSTSSNALDVESSVRAMDTVSINAVQSRRCWLQQISVASLMLAAAAPCLATEIETQNTVSLADLSMQVRYKCIEQRNTA